MLGFPFQGMDPNIFAQVREDSIYASVQICIFQIYFSLDKDSGELLMLNLTTQDFSKEVSYF